MKTPHKENNENILINNILNDNLKWFISNSVNITIIEFILAYTV